MGKIFDFMKVRYSLGKTGKDNVDAWQWMQIYNINPTGGNGIWFHRGTIHRWCRY